MTKYSKIWANGRKKVIPWIASSKSSDQKRHLQFVRSSSMYDLIVSFTNPETTGRKGKLSLELLRTAKFKREMAQKLCTE